MHSSVLNISWIFTYLHLRRMPADPTLTVSLRDNVQALLRGTHQPRQLTAVVHLCVALSMELLSRKSGGKFLCTQQGLATKDLAFDAVAELFQRDDAGRFVQLETYFESYPPATTGDEELLIALRRLVYSRTNHALFRMYRDVDPVLFKILRNVKLAVERMQQFHEVERFGETYIVPAMCETLEHLPALAMDDLENELLAVALGDETIPRLLGKLALLLKQQSERARMVPLIGVAMVMRAVYARRNEPLLPPASADDPQMGDDLTDVISQACAAVRHECHPRYVGKGKTTEAMYGDYFEVIEESLYAKLQGDDGVSYLGLLQAKVPGLTHEEYKKMHRSRIEYLGSLAAQRLAHVLRGGDHRLAGPAVRRQGRDPGGDPGGGDQKGPQG